MGETKIEWTDRTWNPVRGCSVVSEGCRNCYAMNFATRFAKEGEPYEGLAYRNESGAHWTGKVKLIEKHLNDPLRWRKPCRVFVNSMSDLFHESIPDEWIDKVFAVMALSYQHAFQVLTKRPTRMRDYFSDLNYRTEVIGITAESISGISRSTDFLLAQWPLPFSNVWLGVSVEDQKTADERIPLLLGTPAAVRFISYEPALGPVNFRKFFAHSIFCEKLPGPGMNGGQPCKDVFPDWVIVGGESGHSARGMSLDWLKSVIDQCKAASAPVFVKQLGAHPYQMRPAEGGPKGVREALANITKPHPQSPWFKDWTLISQGDESFWVTGPRLKNKKGGDMSEWPEDLRVREFPQVTA